MIHNYRYVHKHEWLICVVQLKKDDILVLHGHIVMQLTSSIDRYVGAGDEGCWVVTRRERRVRCQMMEAASILQVLQVRK